jgi:hypothetical protein
MTTPSRPANPIIKLFLAASPVQKLITLVVLLAAGLLFWTLIKNNTTVSFTFLLDGKPLSGGIKPAVHIDGKAFTSGLTITPGIHKLTAELQNAEPFTRRVWVFFGAKDLGALPLETSKGSLLVSVNPSPAAVIARRGVEVFGSGNAPLTVENLPLGDYELEIKRNEYKEVHPVKIQGKPRTTAKIELNLGGVELSAMPTNADFKLSGGGRQWDGKLPTRLDDVPVGSYKLIVRRGGHEETHQVEVFRQQRSQTNILLNLGSLDLSATPTNADYKLSGNGRQWEGKLPARLDDVGVGNYNLVVSRGKFEETHQIQVLRQQRSQTNILLNLGSVDLSATPTNADYKLSGNGHQWEGKLPVRLDDVPVGDYRFLASRGGWELSADISIQRGNVSTSKIDFHYGRLEILSDPAGLNISSNGVSIGKAPLTISELQPGKYSFTAEDKDNQLTTTLSVGARESVKHTFAFRYGALKLDSTPPGATVLLGKKELGTTPLMLARIPAGERLLEFRLDGYVSTNLSVRTLEGVTTNYAAKLVSERYLQALKRAREAFAAGQFPESQKFLASALESEPNDPVALRLRDEVSHATAKAEEAMRLKQAEEKARELAALPWLDFQKMIADCTDTKQVTRPVTVQDGYHQTYFDDNGKKRTRFVVTGQRTVMQTTTESTFNPTTFSDKYVDRTFRFSSLDKWNVSKVDNDGVLTLKAKGLLDTDQIKLTPTPNDRDAFRSLQRGQKVIVKAVVNRLEDRLLIGRILHLGAAEVLEK